MVDLDVSWFSSWCLTTEGVFGGIPLTSANLRWLVWRLAKGQRLPVVRSGSPGDANARVDGIAALDANGPIRVLAYHYTPTRDANGSHAVRLVLGPLFAGSVLVRRRLLDADHGTWWKLWADILRERSIASADLSDSIWSPQPLRHLHRPADRQAWQAREKEFAALACLSASEERLALGPDRTLALPLVLSPHAVVLVEVEPSTRATTPEIKIEGKVGHDNKNENLNKLPGKIGPGYVHWPDLGGLLEITAERKKTVDDTVWEVIQGHPCTHVAGREGGSR